MSFKKFLDVFVEFCRESSEDFCPRDFRLLPRPKMTGEEEGAGLAYLQSHCPPRHAVRHRAADPCDETAFDARLADDIVTCVKLGRLLKAARQTNRNR